MSNAIIVLLYLHYMNTVHGLETFPFFFLFVAVLAVVFDGYKIIKMITGD